MLKQIWSTLINKFLQIFKMDFRSLALLRMSIATLGFIDVALRSRNLLAHYSDDGVLPRATLFQTFNHPNNFWWSVNFISGSWQIQLLIFISAALFFIALFLGYKTRWATLFCFIFLVSIQARNPLLLQKSDDILRLILLWGFFLPWGSVYSSDAVKKQSAQIKQNSVISIATFAYFVQIMLIYITAALLKSSPIWRGEGSAIFYSLASDQYTTAIGYMFLNLPSWVLTFMTHCVWWFELLGTFLLIMPFFNSLFRILGIVLIIMFHAGIGLTMNLNLFSWICAAGTFAFIPSIVWEKIRQWLPFKKQQEFILYYDDDCGFCKKTITIFKMFLFLPDMQYVPAKNSPLIFTEMEEKNSWIIARGNTHFYRFDVFIALLSASPVFWPLEKIAKLKVVKIIGEKLYQIISDRRNKTCPIVQPPPFSKPVFEKYFFMLLQFVAAFFLLIVVIWNVNNVASHKITISKTLTSIAYIFRLDQQWDMFAPYPFTTSYWYVASGNLQDKSTVNVFNEKSSLSFDKPKFIAKVYGNSRWGNYLIQIFNKKNNALYLPYGKYVCQQWNNSHTAEKKLISFQVFMMSRYNHPGRSPEPYIKTSVWQYRCPKIFDK